MAHPIRVAGVTPESIVDGPGIRRVLFVQGCPHRCPQCHNPQTHAFDGGTLTTAEALLEQALAQHDVRAMTLSGGEPFCQPEPLAFLAGELKARGWRVMSFRVSRPK